MTRPQAKTRHDYSHFERLTTRWHDNDVYGHVNNAVHYQLFDTAVNGYLLRQGALDYTDSEGVFLVVSSGCDYFSEIAFPDTIHAGLHVALLGSSSVTYDIGLFRNDEDVAAAQGRFVHVNVGRHDRRPRPIEGVVRAALEALI